jgi:uncharacterized protein YjbI with pentapeptide repeats
MKLHREKHRLDVSVSDLSGSRFDDVNLSGATYENVNMSGGTFHDVNMSGWRVKNVNLSGLRIEDCQSRRRLTRRVRTGGHDHRRHRCRRSFEDVGGEGQAGR